VVLDHVQGNISAIAAIGFLRDVVHVVARYHATGSQLEIALTGHFETAGVASLVALADALAAGDGLHDFAAFDADTGHLTQALHQRIGDGLGPVGAVADRIDRLFGRRSGRAEE